LSIIIRSNNSTFAGSSKGFPPGDVSSIVTAVNDSKVLIKWSDPLDTVIDGSTISSWKGTLLIRNADHYPESIKDGDVVVDNTTRDKYKSTWYTDSGLKNNTKYYYRFFPYNTAKVYNDSSNLVFATTPLSFAPTLKDNAWSQVASASEAGIASSLWNIGDEIDITLNGTYNETITLQIWDFNHFDKSDNTGKAGICFGMKHLMKKIDLMFEIDDTGGKIYADWNNTYMRNTVMNNIYNSMPSDLRSVIKTSKVYSAEYDTPISIGDLTLDRVFLPGCTEVMGSSYSSTQYNAESNQVQFPIFTDNNSRIKKLSNGSKAANAWWTRSPDRTAQNYFVVIKSTGNTTAYDVYEAESCGVCFCFNV